ncbi:Ig-like domain-containing protein [Azospirillum brasilense]|uniref:Ig-like domain-containing protein n=1 Tax=Azospirillum brasilense TaxID=192 RepID=UPI001EDADBB6|nr:SwmB domain-containing protein [Azospirillum brasilense]UKJ76048.1 VCBS repeat-containing protein [Azospirillum brasilense]
MLHSTVSRPAPAFLGCEGVPATSRLEIAFIDMALDDWQALKAEMPSGIEVFLIDSRADGMAAMARALDGRRDIHAIHVLSHGFEGGFQLGSGRFDTGALAQRVEELASIASSLAPDGDILLYGCNVASGRGADFLTALADATGANVAASRTLTGAADRGGDWDLDWVHGAVRTTPLRIDSYRGVMVAPALVSVTAYPGDTAVTLKFDGNLDSSSLPSLSYFSEPNNGGNGAIEINGNTYQILSASITGDTLTLAINRTLTPGDDIGLVYGDPPGDDVNGVLQSSSGIDVATFTAAHIVPQSRPDTSPTLTATGGTTTFNASPVDLFSSITASTNDTGQVFTSLTLTVTGVQDGAAESLTFYIPGATNPLQLSLINGNGTANPMQPGGAIVTGAVIVNGSTATVTLTGLEASDADMGWLLNDLVYNNTAGTPSNGQRVITVTSVTDDGSSNNTASISGVSSTVNVGASASTLPTLTATGGTPTFTQGSASGVDLFSGVTADTNDTGQVFTGLTLTITNVSDAEALLGIGSNPLPLSVAGGGPTPLPGITGSGLGVFANVAVNGTTVTVTLTGLNHTNAQLATLIDGLSYINYTGGTFNGSPMSGNVTAGSRVITVTSVTDDGGNNHTASLTGVSATVTVAAAPPAPVLQSAAVTGDSLVLTYDVALDSANPPAAGAFTVTVGGTPVTVSGVAVDGAGKTVTLTLGRVVAYGDTVAVSYTDPTAGDDAHAIQADPSGRDAASFTGQSVTNNSPDPSTTPPSVTAIDAYVGENVIIVTFDQTLDAQSPLLLSSFGAVDSYIPLDLGTDAILVGSTKVDLRSAVISGNKLVLTTASPFAQGDYVRFTYSDPAGNDTANVLQNLSGLDLPDTRFATLATATRTVNAPSLTATGNATTFTNSSSPADLFSSVTANANDLGQVFTGLTFTVTGVLDGASEYLIFMVPGGMSSIMNLADGASLMSGSSGVTGGATLSGSTLTVTVSGLRLSADEMQSLLDGFYYNNSAGTPSDGQRIITLASVTDSGGSNNIGTLTGISAVVNIGVPPTPVLQSAAVNGASLVLTYDTALDAVNIPSAGSFTVLAGGSPVTVSGVAVNTANKTVTLTLAQPVAHGAAVSVSYADPTAGDDANAIQSFGGGLDAAGFTGRSVTNTTPDPNGVPPTMTLTTKNGGFSSGQGSSGTDLFDGVTASTVDNGQTFTGMVLTVHNVGGTGSTEFLSIGGTDIALSNGTSGSFTSGSYAVTLANGVATVTLSGMALSNGGMGTLIDGIAYKNTDAASTNYGSSETRSIVLRSITDSGASSNSTAIDKVATVTIANTATYTPFLTVVPTNPTIAFTPGTPQQVSFTVTATQMRTLIGSSITFGVDAPSGWSVGNVSLTPAIAAIISQGDVFTLTFDVTSSGTDTSGAFPISVHAISTGIDLTSSVVSSSVMVTVAIPPVLQSASVDGATLVLTYDSALDAANPPAAGAFEVKVGGTTVTVSGVAVDSTNKTVTLTLAQPVTDTDTVTVAYTDPTAGNDANAIQSTSGDDAASFTAQPVTNTTPDTTPPALTSAVLNGTQLTLTYSELLNGAQAPAGAFTVMVGGVARTVTAVATSGKTVILTLDAGTTSAYQAVTVDYTPPGSGAKTADAAGNAAGALTGQPVREVADPSFVLEGTNPFGLDTTGPWSIPTFADIDGDGDLDALVGMSDGTIRFYRNDGTATAPSFTLAGTNPFGLSQLDMNAAPTFVDIDGNGTLDALIGDFNGNTVVYRNVGTAAAPSFTLVGTNPFGLGDVGSANTPSFVDIDGDGHLDALIGNHDGATLFFRNIGTAAAPSFALEATNPFGLADIGSYAQPTFQDIDGDGDLDALIGNFAGDMLFFRNVGSATAPSFTLEGTNPFGLGNVTFKSVPSLVDIDGDGDLDVLAGGDTTGNNIILFRNLPLQPANLALTAASNSGSTTDTLTNVTATAITGQAKAGTTVVLYDGAVALGTTTADANGLWSVTAASLSEGAHSLTAVASNGTNASLPSSTLNVTIDTTAPTLTSAVLSGKRLTLTYSEALDGTQAPVAGAFTVTVGGVVRTVTAVATAGRTVTLTLDAGASSLYEGATVSYTPPGSGAKTVDAAGNAAGALNGQPVRVSGDPKFTLEATNPFGLGTFVGQSAPVFADIDGDGDLDAVVGDWYANIVVYRNVGTAEAPSFTLVGTNPFGLNTVGGGMPAFAKLALADIDGDGDLDLLAGNAGGGIVVYRNDGTATAPSFTLVGTNPFGLSNSGGFASPSLVDIDGDGDPDALIGNADGNTFFYRNIGTVTAPTFALESTNPFGLGNAGNNATPVLVDIDGDGDLDALIGNVNGDTVLYRNVGTATAPSFTLEGTNPFSLGNVADNAKPTFADIDGDGDLDALLGRADGKTVLFRNTTPPPATPTAPTLTAGSNSGSTTDTLTNVTAPAIVGTAVASSTVVLYDGATAIGTVTADASSGLWTLTTASLSDGTHSLTVRSSNVNGTSSASTALTLTIDTKAPTLASATLNGTQLTLTYSELLDGAQTPAGAFTVMVGGVARTVTAVATSGKTVTLTLDGGATAYQSVTVDYTPPGSGAKTADAAGNAAGALTGQAVRVAGDPSFVLEATNPFGLTGLFPQAKPVFVDIDGDGDLDALVGNIGINLQFYRNVGSATAPSFTLDAATVPFGLSGATMATPAFADIDGDGDLDVLVGSNSGSLLFLRNVGTATAPSFTLEATNPFGLSNFIPLASPSIADLDGDGDLDILVGSQGGDTLFYRNVGTATAPSFTLVGTNPFGLGNSGAQASPTMVDIDGDGDLDVLVGNLTGDTVVYRNVGTATAPSFTLIGTNPFGLSNAGMMGSPSIVDIDGDGDLDALVGSFTSLTLFRNVPPTPASLALTTASNSGSTTDTLTNVTAPAITGQAKAFTTVVLYEGATALGTVTADANGLWTVTTASLGDGAHSLTAVSSDATGTSSASSALTVTIDSAAPNTPTVTTALSNSTTPTLTGTAEADSTVTVTVGGATYTTTATGGNWSLNLATATPVSGVLSLNANGTNAVSAIAIDAAGNTSTAGTQSLVIDTTPPSAPTVISAALSNSTTPTLTGTAEADSTVTVTVGGATYTTTATNGTWSLNLATATPTAGSLSLNANGANPVSATATDAAGNVSTPGTQSLVIDTTAPNAPTVTTALSNSTTPILAGTAEADSTVTVTVGGATYSTTATGGNWSIDLATATPIAGSLSLNANGANPVSATATDAAGNVSTPGTQSLTIDTTAPNAPTVTTALTNSTTPTLTGTAEAGATVTVTVGGATYTTTATNGGTWSLNLATATPTAGSLSLDANGANPVSATATDAAGNVSSAGTQSLTVDTTLPNAPAVTSAALSNNTTPTLAGTAEAGSTVTVTVGGATYTTTATGGNWSINLATATPTSGSLNLNANGANPVSATATDAAGNVSGPGTQSLTIDTTAPNAPTVTTALTNSTTPTLTGTAEAGATVTVTVGGATYTTTATNGGTWSLNLATATPTAGSLSLDANGANPVSATATDAAGNVSSAGTQSLTVDTTLPNAPAVTSAALSNNTTPTLAGTAEAGSTVTVTVGGATYTTTATNGGAWSLNLATETPVTGTLGLNANGANPVSATATDAAGNVSTPGTQSLTIDTTPPNAPTVTTALSNSTTPTLAGTAEAGSTVTVTVGGATYTTTATGGNWSIDLATATPVTGSLNLNANGANPVSATATDAAGNTSSAGTQSLTIDTTLPDAPTVATALTNSTTPTLTGTAEAGSTVTVTVGGATYTTTATGGNWSVDLATATPTAGSLSLNPNGTNPVSATATDASGNVSAPGTQSLVIDTTLPDAPTVTTALSNSTTPTLTGSAEAGSTVTVTVGGATYITTATNGGAWSLNLATATPVTGTLSLNANGANPVSATATDAAGNISVPGTQSLTVDTTPPTASVLFEDDSIDAIEQSSAAFTISGGEAGTSFTWTITSAGGGQVTGSGVMSGPTMRVTGLDLAGLGDGTLTLTLGLTDPAGNASPPFTAATQKLTATAEKPAPVAPPPTATVDGATVNGAITTGSDGKRVTTVTIAASNEGRVEDSSTANADLADVPVVREQVVDRQTGAVSTVTTLTVSVSNGVAVTTSGSAERQTAAEAQTGLAGLIAAIEARTDAGTASRGNLTGGGSGFLSVLSTQAQLLVRAIDFSTPGATAGQAVQTKVTGNTLGGTGVASTAPTAVVLNTTAAAGPVTIQLDNVEFAAVVGNATLVGGDGEQIVYGDDHQQYMYLGAGDDILHGGGGNDTIASAGGNDTLYGDDGDDVVMGGEGDDWLFGGEGNDLVGGGVGNDALFGGTGRDILFGEDGDDTLTGEEGDDTLSGGAGNDLLFGGVGNDFLIGDAGDDTISGGLGNDVALGGAGRDLIGLGAGDDLASGDGGDDTLFGEEGADTLFGGAGNDLLNGGAGNDVLFADGGADTLWGGAGADVFAFGRASGGSVVMDFQAGVDRLALYDAGMDLGAVIRSARVEGGNTTLDVGSGNRITILGQTGNVAGWFG